MERRECPGVAAVTRAQQAHLRLMESGLPRRKHEQQVMEEGNRRGGLRQHNKPLWDRRAAQARGLYAKGLRRFEIARELNVSRTFVQNCIGRKRDERRG